MLYNDSSDQPKKPRERGSFPLVLLSVYLPLEELDTVTWELGQ